MKILSVGTSLLIVAMLIANSPANAGATPEVVKWYGVGGELNGPTRWLGRIGLNEYLGVEVVFSMLHETHETADKKSTTVSRIEIGPGIIYDVVPGQSISPYLAGRFILILEGNDKSDVSGGIEACGGVEYLILKRIGISGELNFRFQTEPSTVYTTTLVRFYFYF